MKISSQAIEVEKKLIGCLLIDKTVISRVQNIVNEKSFYKENYALIFEAVKSLDEKQQGIDIITVTEELRKKGTLEQVGGAFGITKLTSTIALTNNAEQYAKIIQEKYIRRSLDKFAMELSQKSSDETIDIADLISFVGAGERDFGLPTEAKSISKVAMSNLKRIFGLANKTLKYEGIKSGLQMDRVLFGFQNSNLIIIAARPSMGKTALMVTFVKENIKNKVPAGVFSLEMSAEELEMRLKVNMTGIDNEKIKSGQLYKEELEEIENVTYYIRESKISIDDKGSLNVNELRLRALEMKRKLGIKIIYIDYLQLMSGVNEAGKIRNRENEVAQISRQLKSLAKEIDIPIVAFSQLNRAVESRPSKIPQLSDLRESGAIEQDADVVTFLHRPEKYGVMEYDDGSSTEGRMDIFIAKHRNGELGYFREYFEGSTMTIKSKLDDFPF